MPCIDLDNGAFIHDGFDAASRYALVVSKDTVLRTGSAYALYAGAGLDSFSCAYPRYALSLVRERAYELVVLDVDGTGPGVEDFRRACMAEADIVALVRDPSRAARAAALDAGAAMCLPQPFSARDLAICARMLRRRWLPSVAADHASSFRDVTMDLARREVEVSGGAVHLTRTQFNFLAALIERPGELLTDSRIETEIVESETSDMGDTIRHLATGARKALERAGGGGFEIRRVREPVSGFMAVA